MCKVSDTRVGEEKNVLSLCRRQLNEVFSVDIVGLFVLSLSLCHSVSQLVRQ